MSFEIYRSQLITDFQGKRSRQTFFFLTSNTGPFHSHRVASSINFSLSVETDWLLTVTSMITEHAFIRQLRTRRTRPIGGPSAYNSFGPTEFPGRLLGTMADNFVCAKLQWHTRTDAHGKYQVRIGPISEGATGTNSWSAFFSVAALAFATLHIAPRTLDIGLDAVGSVDELDAAIAPIQSATLHWPPTRQKNRRSRT
jgi:hypothetical protein